ncbi:winged helix DNA-binding protein [Phytomonospora sp. NPDC050363]|uniref:GbsR/MarR family transcriptional regulator n=1 Tax=Phytomonospora sp. NPDC050363 TaxID=3155642 RepID=UPI0033D07360
MAGTEQTEPARATDAELAFVEEFALTLERMGLVRMAGRVIAWLTICDPPEQTFNQIADTLQASKGSISNSLRFLTTAKWVIRSSRPGDRKDYFHARSDAMTELVGVQSSQYGPFVDVTSQGLDVLADAPAERRARLQEMHDFFAWLDKELPIFMRRWEAERPKRTDQA